ncbi:MAG: hypothetical protein ACPGQL_10525 [Thermoplasmatota archaeon]
MSDTVTHHHTPASEPFLFSPTLYWRVSAFALSAVAILGIVVNAVTGEVAGIANFLEFDWVHNILHVVLALAAFVFGFGNVGAAARKYGAIVFGFVYMALGVFGLIAGPLSYEIGTLMGLELGENLVHVVLGAWALTAGFGAKY